MAYTRFFTRFRLSKLFKMSRKTRDRMFKRIAEEKRVAQVKEEVQQKKERRRKFVRYPDGELWVQEGGLERRAVAGEGPAEGDEVEEREDNVPTEAATPVDPQSSTVPLQANIASKPPTSYLSNPIDSDNLRSRLQSLSEVPQPQQVNDGIPSTSAGDGDVQSVQQALQSSSIPPPRPPRSPLRPKSPPPLFTPGSPSLQLPAPELPIVAPTQSASPQPFREPAPVSRPNEEQGVVPPPPAFSSSIHSSMSSEPPGTIISQLHSAFAQPLVESTLSSVSGAFGPQTFASPVAPAPQYPMFAFSTHQSAFSMYAPPSQPIAFYQPYPASTYQPSPSTFSQHFSENQFQQSVFHPSPPPPQHNPFLQTQPYSTFNTLPHPSQHSHHQFYLLIPSSTLPGCRRSKFSTALRMKVTKHRHRTRQCNATPRRLVSAPARITYRRVQASLGGRMKPLSRSRRRRQCDYLTKAFARWWSWKKWKKDMLERGLEHQDEERRSRRMKESSERRMEAEREEMRRQEAAKEEERQRAWAARESRLRLISVTMQDDFGDDTPQQAPRQSSPHGALSGAVGQTTYSSTASRDLTNAIEKLRQKGDAKKADVKGKERAVTAEQAEVLDRWRRMGLRAEPSSCTAQPTTTSASSTPASPMRSQPSLSSSDSSYDSSASTSSWSSRSSTRSRRLAHWSPPIGIAPQARTHAYAGGFQAKKMPRQWTPEEDEEIIARVTRSMPAPIKVSSRRRKVRTTLAIVMPTSSASESSTPVSPHPYTPTSSDSDTSGSEYTSDGYSSDDSSVPRTPGHFIVDPLPPPNRTRNSTAVAERKTPSLCDALTPVVGILGPLLVLSSFF
ncbi:hypothetical protein EIP91_009059 [Steccherinum ochraceum]|uniref:Uncharacterized protein n=1 Tax=Steccherinum ochraceum TaxID=92696 RepID=A0A4R0R7N1_9APHY|nr:hypothetical protein EIP91_009059 [Steccherinum ochraceum]